MFEIGIVVQIRPAGGAGVFAGDAGDEVEGNVDLLVGSEVAPVEDQLAAAQLEGAYKRTKRYGTPQACWKICCP